MQLAIASLTACQAKVVLQAATRGASPPVRGVAEEAKPFLSSNFQATLRNLTARMSEAASNPEFDEAARLRGEVKRVKMLDLEFANDPGYLTSPYGDRCSCP